MLYRRHARRLATAFVAVLSMLFAQLALAAYVCPQDAAAAAMTAMMEAGVPCEGMDEQQPALCHQHTADPGKAFEAVKLPAASLPILVHVIELPATADRDATAAVPWAATPESQPPPDPLFLSTLRLRV
jgi:hypothetical protein